MKRLLFIFAALLLVVCVNAQSTKVLLGGKVIQTVRNLPKPPRPPHPPKPPVGPRPIGPVPRPDGHSGGKIEPIRWPKPRPIPLIKPEITAKSKKDIFILLVRECLNGKFDSNPDTLLTTACDTEKYNLIDKGVEIAERAMNTSDITSEHLLNYTPKSDKLIKQWQKMSSCLVETLFIDRISVGAINMYPTIENIDNWELFCKNNREMSAKYSPTHNPLLKIVESPDFDEDIEYFIEATDSVIAHPDAFSHRTKENLFTNLLLGLMYNDRHADALDYFATEPLRTHSDTTAAFLLDLTTCALVVKDQDKVDRYLNKASELDSALTRYYLEDLYNNVYEEFLVAPDIELGKYLVENNTTPAFEAFTLLCDLTDALKLSEPGWEWLPDSYFLIYGKLDFKKLFIELFDYAIAQDEGQSPVDILYWLKLFNIYFSINDNSDLKKVENEYIALRNQLAGDLSPETASVYTQLIINQAYVAGHGLDKPKQALKILKKNIKFLQTTGIDPVIKADYYDYMSALYTKLGKKKDAEKYQLLATELKKDAEMLNGSSKEQSIN